MITRTVRDSAASLDITADNGGHFLAELNKPIRFKVGVSLTDPSGRPHHPQQKSALDRATTLLSNLGHEVVNYEYPKGLEADWFDYLWIFDLVNLIDQRAQDLGRKPEPHELEPLTWQLMKKAMGGGQAAHQAAQTARTAYNRIYLGSMENIDLLLTPSLAITPPDDGILPFTNFTNVDDWNEAGYGFAPFSIPSNISGQPSAACPWFHDDLHASVSVQISGKPGADMRVLQICAQIEKAMVGR